MVPSAYCCDRMYASVTVCIPPSELDVSGVVLTPEEHAILGGEAEAAWQRPGGEASTAVQRKAAWTSVAEDGSRAGEAGCGLM